MQLDEFRTYCLSKSGVEESFPFGGETVWMKVMGKLFAMTNIDDFRMDGTIRPPFYFINLKCDPEKAIELRESHRAIQPGWHQSKTHWNSLYPDGSLPDTLIKELIDLSYELVAASLSKSLKEELKNL